MEENIKENFKENGVVTDASNTKESRQVVKKATKEMAPKKVDAPKKIVVKILKKEKESSWTTIYVPKSLHRKLASIVLEQSVKTGEKIRIWEYIKEKIRNEKAV